MNMSIWVVLKKLRKIAKKKSFIVRWKTKKISDKEYEHLINVWDRSEIKCDVLLLANVF